MSTRGHKKLSLPEYTLTVCFVGPTNAGKTTLCDAMTGKSVKPGMKITTVSTLYNYKKLNVCVEGNRVTSTSFDVLNETHTPSTKAGASDAPNAAVTVIIADTAGQKSMNTLVTNSLRNQDVVLCCFDIVNMWSLLVVGMRMLDYTNVNSDGTYILVGCKQDLSAAAASRFVSDVARQNYKQDRVLWARSEYFSSRVAECDLTSWVVVTMEGKVTVLDNEDVYTESFTVEAMLAHAAATAAVYIDEHGTRSTEKGQDDTVTCYYPTMFAPFIQWLATLKLSDALVAHIYRLQQQYWNRVSDPDTARKEPRLNLWMSKFYETIPVMSGMARSYMKYINSDTKNRYGGVAFAMECQTSALTKHGVAELIERDVLISCKLKRSANTPNTLSAKAGIVLGVEEATQQSPCGC